MNSPFAIPIILIVCVCVCVVCKSALERGKDVICTQPTKETESLSCISEKKKRKQRLYP